MPQPDTHNPALAFEPRRRARSLKIIEPIAWEGQPIPERRWIVDGLIPHGVVTMLNGDGGIGKSLLTMQLMTCAALGKPWLGRQTTACRTLGLFCEDDTYELHRRQADINRHYDVAFADLENVRMISRVGYDNILVNFPSKGTEPGRATKLYSELLEEAKDFGAQLVIIDTIADVFGGNENFRAQVRQFVNELRRIALETDGAVVVTAHPSQAGLTQGTGVSGSTAWNNTVRSRLYLTRPRAESGDDAPDTNDRVLRGMKSNYGRSGGLIRLRWADGVFVVQEEPTGMGKAAAASAADRVFMECFRTLVQQGVRVSSGKTAPNYAPRFIHKLDLANRTALKDLDNAMWRLLTKGVLRSEEFGPPSKRRSYLVAVETGAAP